MEDKSISKGNKWRANEEFASIPDSMEDKSISKGDKRRANQEAAGIPDSKPFVAPGGATGETRILNSHINGVLVSELNLPPHVVAALDWHATDEGIAAAAANPNARPSSGITLVAGPWDKALEERRDDVKQRDMFLVDARDPFKEVADKYAVPGMRPKFMRDKKDGATGDHVVVRNEKGDPVKVQGMILGHMPEEQANARSKNLQARSGQLLKQIGEQYKKEGGKTAVVLDDAR